MKISEFVPDMKIGRLKLLEIVPLQGFGRVRKHIRAVCDCGASGLYRLDQIGVDTFSCGCYNNDLTQAKGKANKTHGMSGTNTYANWCGMWDRTTNPKHEKYPTYKERKPPEEWRSFEKFYSDMGDCPTGFTLERENNLAPYGPNNCIWTPKSEQGKNTSRVHMVEYRGEKMTRSELLRRLGLTPGNFSYRHYVKGMSVKDAIGVEFTELRT